MQRRTYSAGLAAWIAAAAPLLIGVAPVASPAQPPGRIPVTVLYINDFAAGYDASAHTYRPSWIRAVLTDARTREVEAFGNAVRRISIPQHNNVDGSRVRCQDLSVTGAPPGVVALRWTVKRRHPLTGRIETLKTETRPLQPLRYTPPRGSPCLPTRRPLVITKKEYLFRTELATASASVTSAPATYTIQVEALNAQGRALHTGESAVSIPRRVPLIVSVGESLASGEGNPDEAGAAQGNQCEVQTSLMLARETKPAMLRQPQWLEAEDHRSLRSAPALAARMMLKEWPYVVFLSFAKSGARITSNPHDILDQLARVAQVVGTYPIDALLISAGGNDIGFAVVLRKLTKGSATALRQRQIERRLDSLRTVLYPSVNPTITSLRLNVGRVIINEYPGGLFNDANNRPARGCGVFALNRLLPWLVISENEAKMIDSAGRLLNAEVARAASRGRWRLVDGIDEKFAGHGYCSGRSWYVFAENSCDRQGDFDGTMHPNAEGTLTIATAIAKELRSALPPLTGQRVQGR